MATFNLANMIDVRDTCSNIDYLYGPYTSIQDAISAVTRNRRALGRTVGIIESGGVVEYWWKAGIEDEDLVQKTNSTPRLEYTENYPEGTILRGNIGDTLSVQVKFTSSTYGQCVLTVYKDGNVLKTIKTDKGIITINLGEASTEGTSIYTITGVDALTIPAEESLVFKSVIGGAKISSDFQDLLDSGINTSSNIQITYNASVADTSKVVKVHFELLDSENNIVKSLDNQGTGDNSCQLSGQIWNIGAIGVSDNYRIIMIAYTGDSYIDIGDDDVSTQISYEFMLMGANEFKMSSTATSINTDTNTSIVIPFRINAGSTLTLQAHGKILDSLNNEVSGISLNRSVPSNTTNYWAIGKINNSGQYHVVMYATTVGGEESPTGTVYVNIPLNVDEYTATYNIITNGLIADFEADGKSNNNDLDTSGYWRNSVQNSPIYFELNDLNYNTNGWKHVDESIGDDVPEGEMMLKFTGDSYGRLKTMSGNTPNKESDSDFYPMALLRNSQYDGLTVEIIYRTRCIGELNNKVITSHYGSGTNTSGYSVNFDTVTVGSNDSINKLDVSEEEWIHATLVIDKTIHTNVTDTQDYAPSKLMTIYINGSACSAVFLTDNMTFSDYPTLLNSAINTVSDSVDYFGSCEIKAIRFYNRPLYASEVVNNYIASIFDEGTQATIAGRNGDVLPIVRFIKNGDNSTTFADLNNLTQKSLQKSIFVYSRVLYEPVEGDVIEWPNVEIRTQGTSSLQFPVKNYKIIFYTDNTYSRKQKTDMFESLGWQKESAFTLKCDYMEAAHLNNTPTCGFYNDMIDSLIESGEIKDGWDTSHTTYTAANDERSQSRRDGMYDAIRGFPCLVYYYESEADYANDNGTYAGSYMFNIDKSGKSLGFSAPAKLDVDGETIVQIENPRHLLNEEEDEYVDNICQSFEGVANKSNSAGCFYSFADYCATAYRDDYCATAYARFKEQHPSSTIDLDEFIQEYAGSDKPYAYDAQNNPMYLVTEDNYEIPYKNEYDYFAADFEPRYDYGDLESGGEEFWGNSNWGLKRMIDWVSSTSASAGTDNDVFKRDFSQYFNFMYCAIYYLQMMTFGQVDNAGKNSMWDSWDGIHWMPRPYDLDTQAGLNNTGYESIDPDAELIESLSPFRLVNATPVRAGYSEDVSSIAGLRYQSYNTRTSKFWIAFATSFKSELDSLYATLRNNGIYTIDHIMDYYKSQTLDIIGEAYYNRDMVTKFYKLSDINTYIDRMHGNRIQRFKAWMEARIVFCDTLFNYVSSTLSLNNPITFRSDAATGTTPVSVAIGIKVYSPQYILIEVGSGRDAILETYCSPESRYIDPITGDEMEGVLFTLPFVAGNKETSISGAGNIKEIVNISGLKASSLTLNNAKRLTELDVSYSTKLTALSLSNNTYLRSLNCTGSTRLGTDATGAQLDLSNCENLKYLYLNGTKLSSVVFPIGGSLKVADLSNTALTAVSIDSMNFLTSIDVSNCSNILSYSVTNCPRLPSISADDLPLTSVYISNCPGLTSVSLQSDNSISSLIITLCPNIQYMYFNSNRSNGIKILDLTTLYNLIYLNISGSVVETVKFPLTGSPTSDVAWGSDFKTLSMTGSNIKYIQYGETPSTGANMGQLTGLSSLSFYGCGSVEHIYNLNYRGSCSSLFRECYSLLDISGSITCNGSASSMFSSDYLLNNISGISFNFSGCTNLSSAFYRCPYVKYTDIKKLLDACGTSLTDISSICYDKGYGVTYGDTDTQYTNLPAYFFGNCKNVTSAASAFYSSKLKSINNNAFVDSSNNIGLPKLKTASLMFSYTNISSIRTDIMNFLYAVTNANGLFQGCTNLSITIPANFFQVDIHSSKPTTKTSNITTMRAMFYGCSNVVVPMDSLSGLLSGMDDLTDARLVFGNCTKCTGVVPEGFFALPKIAGIDGFFANTRISGLPSSGSLFRRAGDTTSNISTLKTISGLFHGCSSITDNLRADLFAGANEVTTAGEVQIPSATSGYVSLYGLFYNCTSIQRFSVDVFKSMPKLQNISGLFRGCSGLATQISGDFDGSFLNTHEYLTDVHNLFYGCTNLTVNEMPELFTASKSRITNAANAFRGCTSIVDFSNDLLSNMTQLLNASGIFYGCTGLSFAMTNKKPFVGCTSLEDVSSAFRECSQITGSVPNDLFDSCRSTLKNVSNMFRDCLGLNGTIGVGNEDTVGTEYGLLANCLNLTTAMGMFYGCKYLNGAIPWDMFYTDSSEDLYSYLTDVSYLFYNCGLNQPTYYVEDDTNYLFHPEFFSKLGAITTTENTFGQAYNGPRAWTAAYPVYPTSFNNQYFLTSIKEMFNYCGGLGGTVTNDWFKNSISRLTNAYGAFAHTRITGVGDTFLRANSSTANTKLAYVSRMFYGCNLITSYIPACNNPVVFTKVDFTNPANGYNGYCYNCTNALNYSSFSGGWITNQNY